MAAHVRITDQLAALRLFEMRAPKAVTRIDAATPAALIPIPKR